MQIGNKPSRALVIGGRRTPFVRAFGPYLKMDTIALGGAATAGLIDEMSLDKSVIDAVVWGGVILPTTAPNLGREIALDLGLPYSAEAFTVTRACASGLQAITCAAAMIERGEADVVIAGGSDSTSNVGVELPNKVVHAFAPIAMGKGAGVKEIAGAVKGLWPFTGMLPGRPQIAERTTGELMGESAERMAEINAIEREDQDKFAYESHHRAAKAYEQGLFDNEVLSVTTPSGEVVERDGLLRADTTVEKLAKLRPAFKEGGTLTAGNSSALTDGAAAVLLMSEKKAKELGYQPLAEIVSWAYAGVDPADQLLLAPALAMPMALERAGFELDDMDFVDMHEAFAAQVLSIVKVMADKKFCKDRLGRAKAVGKVPAAKLNLYGGSLALGHPFGATGARMVTTVANELQRGDKSRALLGICAAGGLGAAAVLQKA